MKYLNKELSYQGNKIPYSLIFKDQKYIRLKIENQKIIVSAPVNAADWEIEHLIYQNIHKIIKVLDLQKKLRLISLTPGNSFVKIMDKEVPVILYEKSEPKIKQENVIYLKFKEDSDEMLKQAYKKLSILFLPFFTKRLNLYKEHLNLECKNLTIQVMKSKWGVCFPDKQLIKLNPKLIHYPIEAIDYVIVHELAHLVHKNHSKQFWHYVQSVLPDYKKRSALLKLT